MRAVWLADPEVKIRAVQEKAGTAGKGLLIGVGDLSRHRNAARTWTGFLLGQIDRDRGLPLRSQFGCSFIGVASAIDCEVAKAEFIETAWAWIIAVGVDVPLHLGFRERFAHVVIRRDRNLNFVGEDVGFFRIEGNLEGIDAVFLHLEGMVSDESPIGMLGRFRIKIEFNGMPSHTGRRQSEAVIEDSRFAEYDFSVENLSVTRIEDSHLRISRTRSEQLVFVNEARDTLHLYLVAGLVDIAVGEKQGAAFAILDVVVALVDSEAPEADRI